MDPDDVDAETVDDALHVLDDLATWEQAPHRWENVLLILERMATALDAGDHEELRDAIADLDLSAPIRIDRIGSGKATAAPEPVRDLRNTLVHKLTQERSPGPPPDGDGDQRQAR